MSGVSGDFDSAINDRYIYSKKSILYESNHIQVYAGIDAQTQQEITLRFVDENAFGSINNVTPSSQQPELRSKDALFQSGIEIHESEMSVWMSLARSNSSRRFSPEIVDIVQLAAGKTLFALSATPLTSLAQFLRTHHAKYLSESDALFLLAQVAQGAQEYHSANHAHGSISLDNILVMNDPARICLSKLTIQAGACSKNSAAMQAHDHAASTYLAPENLLNISRKPSITSDIYALGIVLFRLIRGRFLYGGSSRSEIYDILSQHNVSTSTWIDDFDAQPLTNLSPNRNNDLPIQISSETQRFLGRMLARKADERPRIEEVISFCTTACMKSTGPDANALNGIFSEPHAIFETSRNKKSSDAAGYFDEDLYFGFLLNTTIDDQSNHHNFAIPITVKLFTPSTNDDLLLENYIAKLREYKTIVDAMHASNKNCASVRIFEVAKLPNNKLAIMIDYSNQGSLEEYLSKRKDKTNRSTLAAPESFLRLLPSAAEVSERLKCHDGIHPANISLNASQFRTGIPLFLNESTLAKKNSTYDYFSPETKKEPAKISASADSWSYGISFYRACFGDLPIFDLSKKPIFQQSYSSIINEHVRQIIESCLVIESENRPTLIDIKNYILDARTFTLENHSLFDESKVAELMPAVNARTTNMPRVTVQDLEGNDALFQYKDNVDSYRMKNMLSVSKAPALRPDQLNARTKNDRGGRFFQRRGGAGPRDAAGLNDDFDRLSDMTASETQANGFFGATIGGPKGIEGNSFNPRSKDVAYVDDKNQDDLLLMNQTMNSDAKGNQPNTLHVIDLDSNPNEITPIKNNPNQYLIGGDDEDYDDANVRGLIRGKGANKIEEDEFVVQATNGTKGMQIIPAFVKGSGSLKLFKLILKVLFIAAILLAVFFRKNIANSWEALGNKSSMKIVSITLLTGTTATLSSASATTTIITSDSNQFMRTEIDYEHLKSNYGCLDNLYFLSPTNEITLLEAISSSKFGFYAFICFVSLLLITALRVYHVFRLDLFTIYQNSESGLLRPFNKYLMHAHAFSYLDFAFLYYSHYQFFHLFFYSNYSPCFGVDQISNTIPILADSARFSLSNDTSAFVVNIFFTVGFAGMLHLASILFYLLHPLKYASLFAHPIHIVARLALYIGYAWIICRIGMSLTFQPTYAFDELKVIPNLLANGEYQAIFGYIPEILELILIAIDVLVESIFHYGALLAERRNAARNESAAASGNAGTNSQYGQPNAYQSALKGGTSPTKRKREQQQSVIELQRNNPVIMKSAVKSYNGGMQVLPSRISASKYPPSISSYQQNPRTPSIQ